jgi:plastocyanin
LLVYLDGVQASVPESQRPRRPTLSSRDKSFEPHVQAVPVGTSVSFPNLDDIMHNVFSLTRGNRFDLGLYKSGAKKDYVFESPGLVRVYCNIHPQMSAFVLVMDNPYYAWAGADGSFRIDGVPPGDYTLKLWHEEGESEQPIMVTEQGAVGLVLSLDVSSFKKRPHLNKFGKPYKKRGKY